MLINGQTALSKKSIEVINPSTGKLIGTVPEADAETITQTLRAAVQGFLIWTATPPAERNKMILRYADRLAESS